MPDEFVSHPDDPQLWYRWEHSATRAACYPDHSKTDGRPVIRCLGCNSVAYSNRKQAEEAADQSGGTAYIKQPCGNWHVKKGAKQSRCLKHHKFSYSSFEEAETAAAGHEYKVYPYFKPSCGSWHLSSMKDKSLHNQKHYRPVTIKPRDYQEASIDSLFNFFTEKQDGNPVIGLPTGTGKSIVFGEFIKRAVTWYPGTRIMVLTHVKELIQQNYEALLELWPTAPAGVFSAGLKKKEYRMPIIFAGIQSVYTQAALFKNIDLLFIDECHLVSPKSTTMYQNFINDLKLANPRLRVVGFSATLYRMGYGMLTDGDHLFTDVAYDLTSKDGFNWMLAQGWLSKPIPKRTHERLNVRGVKVTQGDYVLSDLQRAVDRDEITMAALREATVLAADRRHWLIFASGIEHAEHVAQMLEDSFDITARAVHSRLTTEERDQRLRDGKSGRVQALVNNNILTTGFNWPECDCIIMLRPTMSTVLWVQMLGRGTRPVYAPGYDLSTPEGRLAAIAAGPKPNCLVLDFAGNTERLGPINDPVLPRKKGKGAPGLAPVRLCEACGCYSHAASRFCENPECGKEFPKAVKLFSEASIQDLVAGVLPQIETFPVDYVVYNIHKKEGKPDSMRVTYYSGLRRFNEYIMLDHPGYPHRIAQSWWRQRLPADWRLPPTVHQGMDAIDFLQVPVAIRVALKGKYPEICGYEFA